MEVTWAKTSGTETYTFGDTTYTTSNSELTIASEAMHFDVNVPSDDVDGWALQDYIQYRDNNAYCSGLGSTVDQVDDTLCWYSIGNLYNGRAGDSWQGSNTMAGRPIGFDIRMGSGAGFGAATYS